MMSPARPSLKDRVLTALFGERPTEHEKARALAEQPPRWFWRMQRLFYLIWFGLFVFWCLGALGWLPAPRDKFNTWGLFAINGFGLAIRLAAEGIQAHYARKAREQMKAASPE